MKSSSIPIVAAFIVHSAAGPDITLLSRLVPEQGGDTIVALFLHARNAKTRELLRFWKQDGVTRRTRGSIWGFGVEVIWAGPLCEGTSKISHRHPALPAAGSVR